MDLGSEAVSDISELYRSDTLVVRRVAAGSADAWVVTFDNYGIGHGFDRPGFGEAYLRSQGISAIHVLGRAEDWYQYSDIEAALETVRLAVAGASRVMTYGSSMGGYAAIRFADAVGATSVLAFSPQYTLDPRTAAHDQRWSQDARRIHWVPRLNGRITCRTVPVIVYDPRGLDRWHSERIAQDIRTQPVRLPHTGHPVTSYLAEIGLLGPLVAQVLGGDFDAAAYQREARLGRTRSGVYLGEIASGLAPRRPTSAIAIARRAVEVSGGNDLARVALARILLRHGQIDEALPLFEGLVTSSRRSLTYLVAYGEALAQAGRLAEARLIANEVIQDAVGMAHLHAWAAHICWLNGDVADARRLVRKAVELDPGNRGYLNLATDYHLGVRQVGVADGVRATPWLRLARWLGRRPALRETTLAWMRRIGSSSESAPGT